MAAVRIEDGVVVGTSGGKYQSRNPIARYLLREFERAVFDLAARADPQTIVEIGCGEGHVTKVLLDATRASIYATDLSPSLVAEARADIPSDRVRFAAANIYDLAPVQPAPDLVVCCEVLEHLPDPGKGLQALWDQRGRRYLLSVPREPIFRAMNVARGAYLPNLGNSPGHLQHWSRRSFLTFIGRLFEPLIVRSPLPWTVVLCRPRAIST